MSAATPPPADDQKIEEIAAVLANTESRNDFVGFLRALGVSEERLDELMEGEGIEGLDDDIKEARERARRDLEALSKEDRERAENERDRLRLSQDSHFGGLAAGALGVAGLAVGGAVAGGATRAAGGELTGAGGVASGAGGVASGAARATVRSTAGQFVKTLLGGPKRKLAAGGLAAAGIAQATGADEGGQQARQPGGLTRAEAEDRIVDRVESGDFNPRENPEDQLLYSAARINPDDQLAGLLEQAGLGGEPDRQAFRRGGLVLGVQRPEAFAPHPTEPVLPEQEFIPVEEAKRQYLAFDDETISRIQAQLFAAGFYPDNVAYEDVAWGDRDDVTSFKAWENAVAAAERRAVGGRPITVANLLEERLEAAGGLEEATEEQREEDARKPISLTNPAELGNVLDRVARQTIGKKATDEQKRMFMKLVHTMERRQGQRLRSTPGEVTGPPSPAVAAEELLRQQMPAQAAASDVADTYNGFLSIIGAGG